ncbi:uncharacterized protein FFC1_15680 [Fusarium fujikuroi]|nr:uncharacterized protein FFC1_15680 [Fusarium fujikuroi]
MYYCTFEPGNPTSQHKTACPWCLLRCPNYPVPDWQTNPIPPPTEEQLDRLLHRTSDGLRRYRWILLSVFSFFLVWLLWTICTISLDWYDASKGIITFVDLMDEIAENAGFALSVLQLPLYTFVPLQISGALDPLNGVQSSQFAIIEARAPIHEVISNCLEKASLDDRPEVEVTKNITRTWVDAYYIRYLDQMRRPEETEPQAALRLTKTYIALIEEAFMTLSDRHPSNFNMADFSQDSLYILEEVPTRMDQLRETIHLFTSSYSAFMEEMSQAIMPLQACREYYKTIEYHKQEASFANQRACDAKYIADLYKLSLSKAVIAESAVNHLSRELKGKYVLRLGGDLSEVAVGLSRVRNKLQRIIRTKDRALKWYRREVKRRGIDLDVLYQPYASSCREPLGLDDDRRPWWAWEWWWCRYWSARCGVLWREPEYTDLSVELKLKCDF